MLSAHINKRRLAVSLELHSSSSASSVQHHIESLTQTGSRSALLPLSNCEEGVCFCKYRRWNIRGFPIKQRHIMRSSNSDHFLEEGRNLTTLTNITSQVCPSYLITVYIILYSYKTINKLFLKDQKWIASLF